MNDNKLVECAPLVLRLQAISTRNSEQCPVDGASDSQNYNTQYFPSSINVLLQQGRGLILNELPNLSRIVLQAGQRNHHIKYIRCADGRLSSSRKSNKKAAKKTFFDSNQDHCGSFGRSMHVGAATNSPSGNITSASHVFCSQASSHAKRGRYNNWRISKNSLASEAIVRGREHERARHAINQG